MNTLLSFRTIVPALILFFLPSAIGAQCAHPDYDGLEKFYLATNGDGWTDKTGWLTDCEPCGWNGIECDAAGRVVTLNLNTNGLSGTLPADMDGLTELRHLFLARNTIGGQLPPSIFTLSNLRDLNLSRNKFAGGVSGKIEQLTELESLRIGRNQFTGSLPDELANCTLLTFVSMEENGFSGRIPEGLGDLPFLEGLNLFNNQLEGCFPESLASFCGRVRASFGGNAKLTWSGDFSQLCLGSVTEVEQVGAVCDDGDPSTIFDKISNDCLCAGSIDPEGRPTVAPEVTGINETEEPNTTDRFDRNNITPGVLPTVNTSANRLIAFPNPLVGNSLSVRMPEALAGGELRLLSLTGREITRQVNVATGASINVPVLEAGVYLLEAISGAERSVTRIIVQ